MPNTQPDHATFQRLLQIVLALSGERNIARLYEQIIEAAQDLTHAEGGSLYIAHKHEGRPALRFEVVRNDALGLRLGGTSGQPVTFPEIPLTLPDGSPNHRNICAFVYHQGQATNIKDAYTVEEFDFSGTRAFDENSGYRSQSLLTLPLINHAGDVIGVLQLINAKAPATGETIPFASWLEPIAAALASSAAITLDNQKLLQAHRDLLDAFIQAIAQAIDAKSPHTSGHCQRVPVLTELLAQAACRAEAGPLKDFSLDESGWYELHVAAWLHDCGKLSTPDSLLDKSTKLHALCDRIEAVKARFAALISQTRLHCLESPDPAERQALEARVAALREDCAFLEQANTGSEFMRPEDQERVRRIATLTWHDHQGVEQPLLSPEETDMLCISRGTLSHAERERINDHINVTIQMLEGLPFPKHLARVPEYAGGHHEKVDGTGYPRGLRGDEMSWPARMMAIADVFEALTARDRPYKPPMKLSQALSILKNMAVGGHIDPDLYALFIADRVWDTYARDHLLPEQLDVTDPGPYRLQAATPS
ncbi:MAG: GAF domain-containing protein [Alcaligenaceae bacterium]|nr:GAF domain-containing protein [Alcaligenaceae bacterium]